MSSNTYKIRCICKYMATMTITLTDTTEEIFRQAVARKLGMRKGNLSKALEEAIDLWIKN